MDSNMCVCVCVCEGVRFRASESGVGLECGQERGESGANACAGACGLESEASKEISFGRLRRS